MNENKMFQIRMYVIMFFSISFINSAMTLPDDDALDDNKNVNREMGSKAPVPTRIQTRRRLKIGGPTFINQTSNNNTKQNLNENDNKEDDISIQAILLLLTRSNERLTALQALDEQHLKRLETLEYRLTKLEVQLQEKFNSLHADARDSMRRTQQLDWQIDKIEAMLDSIKSEMTNIKQSVDILKVLHGNGDQLSTLPDEEMHTKLQTIVTSVYSLHGAISTLQDDVSYIKKNTSNIFNITRQMNNLSRRLLTTEYFTTTMLNMKYETVPGLKITPTYSYNEYYNETFPRDCQDVQNQGNKQSGVYKVKPPYADQPFFVYCQLNIRGGGWTVIQRRYEGTINFYRGWQDYKYGFGNIAGEYWLGLEKIHLLTSNKVNELLIELEDFTFDKAYAQYSAFSIASEVERYSIVVLGGYDGNAGDSLIYHAGMKFSTYDMDNDNWEDGSCAESHSGAWWYNGCDTSNLNGRYLNGDVPDMFEYQGMYWYDWHGPTYSLMKSHMLIRPRSTDYTPQLNNEEKIIKTSEEKVMISREVKKDDKFNEDNPAASEVTEF